MIQSPDNSLRDSDRLLGMVARTGNGDTVLVEQLYENTFWGPTASNPTDDPNPRLEAYMSAARDGATVRILLDSVYDDPGGVRSNAATCSYVTAIASSEGLDLHCQLGNPTGTGIHNKMVLVLDNGQGYVHTGSINGSENSSKNNREMAVQIRSTEAYDYLAEVFWLDWGTAEEVVYLPLVLRQYPPTPTPSPPTSTPPPGDTGNIVITHIFYDGVQRSAEADEYVEIRNDDSRAIQLGGWTLRDIANHTFALPSHLMEPGQTGRVYTNEYHPESCGFSCGSGSAIWNNGGDCAYLEHSYGTEIDTYCY